VQPPAWNAQGVTSQGAFPAEGEEEVPMDERF